MFLAAGAHYIVPDFAGVQDFDGSLPYSLIMRAALSPGYIAMPLISTATAIGSTSVANRLVGISPRSR
jgi:hypothetical protein